MPCSADPVCSLPSEASYPGPSRQVADADRGVIRGERRREMFSDAGPGGNE